MCRALVIVALAASLAVTALVIAPAAHEPALEGRASAGGARVPAVEAAFGRESYRPGERARLVIRDGVPTLTLQVFMVGPERLPTRTNLEMNGIPVTPLKTIARRPGIQPYSLHVGPWESGLYFARLEAPDGRVGFAPFVVAPRRLGTRRVAVVLPTLTWQAYNFRDDDGDGLPDSWYAGKRLNTVRLGRAHLDRGVPYGFRFHLGFLNWLRWTGRRVDYLAQSDLERATSAESLRRAYDLVEKYRDLGGNLLFLPANNFFWRVERRGDVVVKDQRWRDIGRPEAALVGVQYVAYQRSPRAPWVARRSLAGSWLFAGTRVRTGSGFGRGGVEIDQVTSASPPGIEIVAEIPDLFGPGRTAQMTYYETTAGARVFAAGAFHLTRAVTSDPVVWRLLENLWQRMIRG